MQTFLTDMSFRRNAQFLDEKRLGKQRVETLQIMKAIFDPEYGWQSHPVTNMWRNHPFGLWLYQYHTCEVWTAKGFQDTCKDRTRKLLIDNDVSLDPSDHKEIWPEWINDERLYASHRSNLLRKRPAHYEKFGWLEPDNLPYFWPTKEGY